MWPSQEQVPGLQRLTWPRLRPKKLLPVMPHANEERRDDMSFNAKRSQMWKYGAGKVCSLGLGMALMLAVSIGGCGSTSAPTLSSVVASSGTQGQTLGVTLSG